MFSVGLYTLGCKVSQYETEAVGEAFIKHGFVLSDFSSPCDVYVINTCTVTQESDRKSRQVIRRAKKNNPDALIMVMGCYSQRSPSEVSEIDGVSVVIGTENKLSLPEIALEMLADAEKKNQKTVKTTDVKKAEFERMKITSAPRTRAYVKIEDGCESKCTYCAISDARGRVRSKAPEDVISEVLGLYKSGTCEIVLTGIETGSYGRDFDEKYDLADLICELDRKKCAERIRLGSLAPELITKDFVERVRSAKILAPHFHLSIQSGSDSVLYKMKRRYNSKMAMDVIENIRLNIPGATFTTDIMVGFPGESEENFLETVDFVKRAKFLDAHVFAYSKRAGTPAASYDGQIPEDIKSQRSKRLIRIKNEVRDLILSEIVDKGKGLSVVCESLSEDGFYTAHSDTYVEVKFKSSNSDLTGKILNVKPVSQKNGIIYGELI